MARAFAARNPSAGQRGQQKSPTKVKTTMRLSPEVIEHFRAQGPGWQGRIDQALKEYISEH
ncbi:BrnA antitoxin family protein [Halomonas sp. PR-M31]|uniref:BrnA antitoxin family protein n=1 Tax=Halomonas sp. PR-M31 TaxID=1471202 RepID=UPI001C0FEAEA|nr:BrnA antitoxin family protein [Halomonas sp. PR-M31]